MKLTKTMIASACLAVSLLTGCAQVSDESASEANLSAYTAPVKFNADWQFFRSENALGFDDALMQSDWEPVKLPHTAKIEPRIVNDQFQGDAWYKKQISVDSSWDGKHVFIDFEAAMNVAEVWVNGEKQLTHLGGYLPFTVDLTPFVQSDVKTLELVVRLDNRDNPITGPKPLEILDFNMYGGIYRNVWLRVENSAYITDAVHNAEVASGGIFYRSALNTDGSATLSIQTHVRATANQNSLEVEQSLLFNEQLVAKTRDAFPVDEGVVLSQQSFNLNEPALWSPDTPNLYTLVTRIYDDAVLVDEETQQVGVREFRFVDNQLYINGEKTFLRGVNRHQEYPYVGYALSDEAQYRDAEKIKAAGFDYVRLSHYPHSKAFMQAADELGLVLIDAILGWQYVSEDPAFQDQVVRTCRDLVRRDRNHASVLGWECSLNESWMEETLIDRFHTAVHEEYPGANVYSAGWQEYGYDLYLQARQHRLDHYKEPTKPYVVSEYGDWEYYAMNAGLNQDAWGDLKQAERSSRQLLRDGEVRLQQQAANLMEAHNDNFSTPAFADGYWVMFDYNRGYAQDLEASGIMSLERLPKFSYYFYQSQRDADSNAGPLADGYMVHIGSFWKADSPLVFDVFTNADEVTLRLNGKEIAKGLPNTEQYPLLNHAPVRFELDTFQAGTLVAEALVDGKVVATHEVTTPGAASKLTVSLDNSSVAPKAGVNDVVFVYATLEDDNNNNSRANLQPVEFIVEGNAELVSPAVQLSESGIAAALVKVGEGEGSFVVSARSDGLTTGQLEVPVQ